MPYIQGLYEMIKMVLKKFDIGIYCNASTTVQTTVSKGWSNGTQSISNAGVVYSISCQNCNRIYIGQTGRELQERVKEHKRAVTKNCISNALARHAHETNHDLDFEKIRVIQREKNSRTRLLLESYSIAGNAARALNLSPPDSRMVNWIDLFKSVFPDMT